MDLLAKLNELSPEKRSLFVRRLKEQGAKFNVFPLSPAQERLWFLDQMQPGEAFYNIPTALRLTRKLRVAVLHGVLSEIARRHESLRTTFLTLDGTALQRVGPASRVALPLVDLSGLEPDDREEHARRLARGEARRPFDLTTGPLARFHLLRLGDEDHVLLATLHHIIADGWSMGVLITEVGELYAAAVAGRPSPLQPLAVQVVDVSQWQRKRLSGGVLEQQLEHWRERLRGLVEIELPSDFPRPESPTLRGARFSFALPPALATRLRAFCRRRELTLYMALLTAFKTVLSRYSGQDDLAVGSTIANRHRRDLEPLIGFFVNTLVIRSDLSGAPSFEEAVERLRQRALDAFDHQDLPFEKLVEDLQPERRFGRHPFFQVMVSMQNAPHPDLVLPELEIRPFDTFSETCKFDLQVDFWEEGEGLVGHFLYSVDLFAATRMRRLAGHFRHLLDAALANPERRLAELPWLSAGERQQLARELDDAPKIPALPGETVLAAFAAQAASRPAAVAISDDGAVLSYGELARRVDRLAGRLAALGISAESRVGLHAERGVELVIGLLGILRAGGAYVPLDPAYPQERLAFLIADSELTVIVGDADRELLPATPVTWVGLEDLDGETPPPAWPRGGQLAYVIYTSGSTGQPKGVLVTHANLVRLIAATSFDFSHDDVWTLFHSFAFDFSVWEIWGALAVGGRLVVVPHTVSRSPDAFRRLLLAERVSVLNQTPSAFRQLIAAEIATVLAAGDEARLDALRHVIFGGEALDLAALEPWCRRYAERPRLVNMYGITETTVHVTELRLDPARLGGEQRSLIGRPLRDLAIHVLLAERHGALIPAPLGVAGEIFVAGAGLARGYLGRPGLSAERFVPDPFSGVAGARLYRTGDKALRLADGGLVYLGRLDHQVKVRGFRIELGEIEAALASHPGVRQAAVALRGRLTDDQRLIAHVVLDHDGAGAFDGADAFDAASRSAQEQQVTGWRSVFDDTYESSEAEPGFDISGWISSYTGRPIPAPEMREWVEETVTDFRAAAPEPLARVLELGCGTGLMLFRLAPGLERYVGTDFSVEAIAAVRRQLGEGLDHVELLRRPADDLSGLAAASFDAVLINSVVQYFPEAAYLRRVLEGAVETVADGGVVVVGDVRSLPLQHAFHASVELYRAADELPLEDFLHRLELALAQDNELVLAPAFFAELEAAWPRVRRVEIVPKGGRAKNEMSLFRYQAILHIGPPLVGERRPASWLDWRRQGLELDALGELLGASAAEVLAVEGIPIRRLTAAVELSRRLAEGTDAATVGELRRRLEEQDGGAGADIEDLRQIAAEHGYGVKISVLRDGGDGACDAVFYRPSIAPASLRMPSLELAPGRRLETSNRPLDGVLARQRIPELRAHLAARLPEHMIPNAFMILDALPLTAHGKVDRAALPSPDLARPVVASAYVAPRDAVETAVVEVWREVLGIERLGVEDDFFELGGHSLLATQVVARLRDACGVELPLRTLFEATTVASLAARVSALRENAEGPALPPLRRRTGTGAAPLSFAQERLWLLDQLRPDGLFFNELMQLRLYGRLRMPLLAATLGRIVARHEVLRTTFPALAGRPVQVVHDSSPGTALLIDLSALEASRRVEEARRLAASALARPFSLARGPLLRSWLLRLRPDEHLWLLSAHHIVIDGWSMGVMRRELGVIYGALCRGETPRLAPLPVQYADFAVWQRSWLGGRLREGLLAAWRDALDGAPELAMPVDRPRPAVQTPRGGNERISLTGDLVATLRERVGRGDGTTLFMVLLAAFRAVLGRYSTQRDLVIGSPVANRRDRRLEGLIGFFVNLLPLRLIDEGGSFAELLTTVRQVALTAYEHQDLPFEQLVEELAPERDLSRHPLFQVSFQLVARESERLELPDLVLADGEVVPDIAKLDLTLVIFDRGPRLDAVLVYNRDLYDTTTARRLLKGFERLLTAAVETPEHKLATLPLLAPGARHQLLREWQGEVACGVDLVPDRLAYQVATRGDAVAMSAGEEALSYGALDRRAGALASRLTAHGAAPERLVAITPSERQVELGIMLWAVWRSGAAYLLIDRDTPDQRAEMIVADAAATAWIVPHDAAPVAPAGTALVAFDGQAPPVDDVPPRLELEPRYLAYVIYTSGSTGTPKGVLLSHGGLANLVAWHVRAYGVSAADRATQLAGLGFDAAVWELWPYLASGAVVERVDDETRRDPERLGRFFAERRITLSFAPTPLAEALLEHGWPRRLVLRALLTGGDRLRRHPPELPFAFNNHYGPTEGTVVATVDRLIGRFEDARPPSIGRPIDGFDARVVDAALAVVPPGVVGELVLGGAGLARGYLGDPRKSAAVFVPDPLADAPGARLYRTGDQARWLADGRIDFVGRRDQQVKLRGHRLELGEIEALLNRHPAVADAVVLLRDDLPGTPRLVAYIVWRDEVGDTAVHDTGELARHLAERLPDAVVPKVFEVLPVLPLTANGKIDRQALPRPRLEDEPAALGELAGDPFAEVVAGIWAELLGVETVGREADFFALGGHSLLATQMLARLRQALGVELPLRAVFEAPRLGDLARRARAAQGGVEALPALTRLDDAERAADPPLSFAQQRLWFLDQLSPGNPFYNVPLAIELDGELDVRALHAGLSTIVARHETLRTTFPERDGRPVQAIASPRPLVLPRIDLDALSTADAEHVAAALAELDAERPFDLARGPLLRAALLRLAPRQYVLLLAMHHIVSDGWSMGVLIAELGELYRGVLAGREAASVLGELAVQYVDYAAWQRRLLGGERLAEQLAHWRGQLAGAATTLELPTDRPRPAVQRFRGGFRPLSLPEPLVERLLTVARQRGVTPFMLAQTALAALLARLSGQDDLLIGTPIAHRTLRELEGLIGFFANTLVLRGRLDGDPSMDELLDRMRETILAAFAHQDLPFERLVEDLAPERDLSRGALIQVLSVLHNAPMPELELPGLRLTPLTTESTVAHFDLTLSLTQLAGRRFVGSWRYDRDLFDGVTVERWARAYLDVLGAVLDEPRQRLSQLGLWSKAERHQVLVEWRESGASTTAREGTVLDLEGTVLDLEGTVLDLEGTVLDLLADQVAARPEKIAVVADEGALSFAHFDRLAAAWSRSINLETSGEGPVGLLMERSLAMAVAVPAVLRAGRAYLPLTPETPAERLASLCADAAVELVLTEPATRSLVPAGSFATWTVDVRDGVAKTAGASSSPGAADLAYVIYTSGSTGRPKGVMMPHGALHAYLLSLAPRLGVDAEDRYLHTARFSFSSSVRQLLLPLSVGATVVIAGSESIADPLELLARIQECQASVLDLVPSHWWSLIAAVRHEPRRAALLTSRVRLVLSASELLPPDVPRTWRRELGQTQTLIDMYGQTETTGIVCTRRLATGGELAEGDLGRALPGMELLVLDGAGRPLPIGVAGEIHIGGPDLARGYLGRPGLTASRFVPHGASERPGTRLFAPGDRGALLADGRLRFLGRSDQQIKVRGFRVELGEIEATLRQTDGIREAAVAVEPRGREARLVACVVGTDDAPGPEALRRQLASRLPDYMVPAFFVFVDQLPRTATGKLDRAALAAALPEPEPATPGGGDAPRTASERLVARVWQEVLGIAEVGVEAHFFALGGHSLLAAQVASRLRQLFVVELPLRALFERPTLSGMVDSLVEAWGSREQVELIAGIARQELEAEDDGDAPLAERIARRLPPALRRGREPLRPSAEPGPHPLSFAQQRLWFLQQLEPQSPAYNIVAAVRFSGRLDVAALSSSLSRIVLRHESLRTTFKVVDAQPVQVVAEAVDEALPMADLSVITGPDERAEDEARRIAQAFAWTPFDLARGPLVHWLLLRLGTDDHVLVIALHHIIGDGWSRGVFLRELVALYEAFVAGRPTTLPALAIQYRDYARWQRRTVSDEAFEEQLARLRRRLAPPRPALRLPTDRPADARRGHLGGELELPSLDAETTTALRRLGRRHDATPFMTVLAAFGVLLHRYTWQDDLLIGCPVANRQPVETEGLIGFFANTLVVRLDLSGGPSFVELLARVRERVLEALSCQDVPFERLVEELQPERALGTNPLFQVLFQLGSQPRETVADLPELELTPFRFTVPSAKFDLALNVMEGDFGLQGQMRYSAELFDPPTIERLLGRFHRLLSAIVEHPESGILELAIDDINDQEPGDGEAGEVALPVADTFAFEL